MDALTLHYARLVFARPQPIYELHRDLCRALGKRDASGYLFRTDVDRSERPAKRVVLVQSRAPGEWDALKDKLALVEARERKWELALGQRYRFFLRANTTQAKKAGLRELAEVPKEVFLAARGKRVALRGEAELFAWLARQGAAHGFRCLETAFPQEDAAPAPVAAVRVLRESDVEWRGNGKRGQHAGVDFEGLLEIHDAGKLADALQSGIGPAKAFGFGLLSLAPAR
jgi:CRISPR system Cascade subunit CasE